MNTDLLKALTTRGCLVLAWLLLAAGRLFPSPMVGFFLAFLVVTCAVLPLAFGTRWQRIGAIAAVVLSLLLVFSLVNKLQKEPYLKQHRSTTAPA
jgi:uncharacterized membrane protein